MSTAYEIVCFFAGGAQNRHVVAGDINLDMINIVWQTARQSGERPHMSLLTDETTAFDGLDPAIQLCRYPLAVEGLLLKRITAQVRFLEGFDFSRPVAVLDTDIIVNQPISAIFTEDFDVAVAFRPSKGMPVNSGVVLLNNRRPEMVRQFVRNQLAVFKRDFMDNREWWGDQLSLNSMIPVPRDSAVPSVVTLDGVRVMLLDYRIWNYSPARIPTQALFRKRASKLLHFKSAARKPDMVRFYRRWFAQS